MNNAPIAEAVPLITQAREIEVRRQGAMIEFALNRPKVLNAFNDGMRRVLALELPEIARNPDIYVVALTSTATKAFCAGGDVKALLAEARRDIKSARAFFAGEYALNWLLECFSKPTVSLADGLCMGSGVGLSVYNTHRVAAENYKFAMPETAIGLFPDVGAAHVLAHLPWPLGLYLGLTGRVIDRADAYWLDLVTHCIPAHRFGGILAALSDAQPVDPLLDDLHQAPVTGPLQAQANMIGDLFGGSSLDDIIAQLKRASGTHKAFADATLAELAKKSPTSLKVTDQHIRSSRSRDLRETLQHDYRIACRCLDAPDFAEGVRAVLLDKDGAPRWSPAALEDVTPEHVARYFAPLKEGELQLPTRTEMQAARI